MASFNKYQKGVEALMEGINAGSDAWKVALTNRAPVVATDATLTDATEISAGNGYTAGGNAATTTSSTQTSGTYKLILASPSTWTASGGSIGPFRYADFYRGFHPVDQAAGQGGFNRAARYGLLIFRRQKPGDVLRDVDVEVGVVIHRLSRF